jgi:hypothetical protein
MPTQSATRISLAKPIDQSYLDNTYQLETSRQSEEQLEIAKLNTKYFNDATVPDH